VDVFERYFVLYGFFGHAFPVTGFADRRYTGRQVVAAVAATNSDNGERLSVKHIKQTREAVQFV
jgi:hypothetical protein